MQAIADEVSRIEESARHSSQTEFSSAKYWRGLHFVIGVPTAVVAGIAGASALADATAKTTVAIIALVAASG